MAGKTKSVCKELVELSESSYVVLTTGSYNVMAEVVCRDLSRCTELLYDRLQMIDGVTSTESFFAFEAHRLAYGWGIGSQTAFKPQPNRAQTSSSH